MKKGIRVVLSLAMVAAISFLSSCSDDDGVQGTTGWFSYEGKTYLDARASAPGFSSCHGYVIEDQKVLTPIVYANSNEVMGMMFDVSLCGRTFSLASDAPEYGKWIIDLILNPGTAASRKLYAGGRVAGFVAADLCAAASLTGTITAGTVTVSALDKHDSYYVSFQLTLSDGKAVRGFFRGQNIALQALTDPATADLAERWLSYNE